VVAIHGNEIVADGALEFERETWKKHTAELRLVVAHAFQHKGLGMLLARELFAIALSKNVEVIVGKFMKPQVRPRRIFKRLGFHQDAILHDYVTDIKGVKQDLVIMHCDVASLWKKMEDYIDDSDWRRTR
jgi:L-amino acid N-acyltransferase YncA